MYMSGKKKYRLAWKTKIVASNKFTFFFSLGTSHVKRMMAIEKENMKKVAARVLP